MAKQKMRCPTCKHEVTVLESTEVAHRCPEARQNKITFYEKVTTSD